MRPPGHPGITWNSRPGSRSSIRMATKYSSTGSLQPSGLGPQSASQVAQQCINQAGTKCSEDECLEKLLQEVDQLRRAGNTKCAAKAFAEGVKLFTAALELKPDATQLLINRAFARFMTADPASADEDCCLALALERREPSAYRWRAAARRDCGWLIGAVEDMRMAARMAPTADKKEAAMMEVGKLEEWIEVLEESETMKKAAEDCCAREAKAPALAAEAKAASERILNERRADLAREKEREQEWRKEQEAHRKQAEEEIRQQAHNKQAAKMLKKMQRSRHVEVLTVDPKSVNITDGKGQTTDIDSFLSFLRPQEARQPSDSSSSASKVPRSSEPFTPAVHAAFHSGPAHTPGTPYSGGSNADSSARHTMSAPAALHSRLFPEPKQAHAGSAAQSASQSTGAAVEEDGNDPVLPFYFAGRQPRTAGESSAAPKPAALPNQAAVDAVLQEIAQKEHNAWLELGIPTASNTMGEADRADRAQSSTASAEATEQPATASAGTHHSAPTVCTKEADTPDAMETFGHKGVKRPRDQEQASDQLPRAQEQQVDAGPRADNTSARDPATDAPSGPMHGISPEASSAADDSEDGCVSEADTVEYPVAETDGAATQVEETPAEAAPQSAAIAAPEMKQEPQPEHEAATDANCGMPDSEQAETIPATAAATEFSAMPEEAASEAATCFGYRSKSQNKKAKRKAKATSAKAAGAAELPLDKTPSPTSEADAGAQTGAATEAGTGTGDVGTCTPSKAATDSKSDDGAPAADGEESVNEPQSAAGQEFPMLDSSNAPIGNADAPAAPETNPTAERAASSSENLSNISSVAGIREAACEMEANLHASKHKAQEAEQRPASTTTDKRGTGLFSAFGGFNWFGMGVKQDAASEASGPVTELDIVSETSSGSANAGKGAQSSPVSPSCHMEGDYPGRDFYERARAAHRRANEQRAADRNQDTSHHYREAVDLCDQALVVNPAIGAAYLTKAACYMHLNKLQGAAEAYASAVQHDLEHVPDVSAHVHVDHILAAVNQEMASDSPDEDVIMALLDAAVRLSRSPDWACQTLTAQGEACVYFGNGPMALSSICGIFSDERVRAAFMSSSKITPAQRERVSNLFKVGGNELQENNDLKGAKCLYSMSIGANPANAASWSNRAYMNLQLCLYGEAVKDATMVLKITNNTKLRDKAHRRRSLAYRELRQFKEAYTDLQDIKRKTDDDIHWIRWLEMALMPLADLEGDAQGDAKLVVTKEYGWVKELPAQKPVLDKSGGVMATRWDPLMDDDAEAGCTKEQLLQRIGMSQKTPETTPATADTDAPETSGAASPTCIASGPYSSSSEGSSPANTQTPMTPNGVPSSEEGSTAGQSPPSGSGAAGGGVPTADEGPTAGQDPPSGGGAAGGIDGCSSRRPSSSYYTAEPQSPLSDASFGSPLSEQTAFLPQDSNRRTSSGSGAVVPSSETSPINTPSDVSNAGDSSDSDSQPSQHPQPRAGSVSFRQPSGRADFADYSSNGTSSLHSNGDGDGRQPDTADAPASRAEPQLRDALSNLRSRSCAGLVIGELPGRVKVAPSSEAPPTGPPKPNPGGPPSMGGWSHTSSQWGAQNGGAKWRQSTPAMRGGFLNRRLPEKQASRPEPAGSFDAAPVTESLPPPPPLRTGFLNRRSAGDASEAKPLSEPQPQPGQHSTSRDDHQPELHTARMRPFKGPPQESFPLQKAWHHVRAGEEAMMKGNVMDASEAADEAVRLVDQVVKQGRTPCDEIAVDIDNAYLLKAMVLIKFGRNKDAMNCLMAALKLTKDCHACREGRASMIVRVTGMVHLAVTDLVKLCELTPPYKPRISLTAHIITQARKEMAAYEQMSARKAKRAARKSSDGSDNPGSRSSTPTTPGFEPMAAERALEDRRQAYNKIITHIINRIAQHDAHQMQHASSHFGGAPPRHMHAPGLHLPAHAPRSFFGSNSWGRAGL